MTDASGPDSIDKDESVIVVSDLHLGGEFGHETSGRFCNFLEAVSRFSGKAPFSREQQFRIGGIDKVFKPPKKIILLGDILEFWASRCRNRDYVTLDALKPFAQLQEMDCDVVYVTGNHDEDVEEIIDAANFENKKKTSPEKDSIDLFTQNTKKFSLHKKHYIPGRNGEGLEVGGVHYAFLHGHQFDQQQLPYSIGECIGARFDPISYIADIANTQAAKKVTPVIAGALVVIWIALAVVLGNRENGPLVSALTLILGGVIVASLVNTVVLFGSGCQKKISILQVRPIQILQGVAAFFALLLTGLILLGFVVPWIHNVLFLVIFAIFSLLVAFTAVPILVVSLQKKFYSFWQKTTSIKGSDVEKIIPKEKSSASDFNPEKYSLTADVVVFGHTHCANMPESKHFVRKKSQEYTGPERVFFCNTGDWERDPAMPLTKECPFKETFVYIDHDGLFLMRWDDKGKEKIQFIKRIPAAMITHNVIP
ncbi:metallophosphoesterase [Methanoregula formicica]|uniref:Calcineurin-like phosphoesterase domain-containing protein n=1 Tax=Methanoregula formicica (strain DSM 22288 / NBRC 105244 / SMSP) TaxID=593750 RepID=L0HJA3_METFS|nr:metallophosphoesterase [Methanoregula formicica]AGB03388.1 hypothetical protein Metfor_2386 [Methanoregula formicica SMSP]